MKKKIPNIKDSKQRDKTPDIAKPKIIKTKKPVISITPSGSTTDLKKKKIKLQKNQINTNSSQANLNIQLRTAINKSNNQKKIDLKKLNEPKKEIQKEYKTINPKILNAETRSKSAAKRSIKQKNREKEKVKKEDNLKLEKKNINNNKDNINKSNNVNSKDDANKDNNSLLNKTENIFNKPKSKQSKKPNLVLNRKKSVDIILDKNRINQKELENNKTREKRDGSIKKRKVDSVLEKTPSKATNVKNKDISPLKTGRVEGRGSIKFAANRNKKQIMNKTPDAGNLRNPKNFNIKENNLKKKTKYGNVDIKSIIKNKEPNENINNEKKEVKPNENINKEINQNDNIKKVVKIIKYRKIRNKKYSSNYIESLYLSLNSGFFKPNKKLKIFINSKELYSNFENKKMIRELIDYYNKIGNINILNNEKKMNEYDLKKINEPFKPNETTINSLNFLDKNEIERLINEVQHPYINELFKAILILLNEYKNNTENKNIFDFIFHDILHKYNFKTIKKLMLNYFVDDRIIISDEQFELIQKMLKIKPDLFSPATLLKYNRAVAYFSFFVKELFSYLNLKTEDGKYYYKIRATLPKNKFQEKINKLKQLL